MSTIGKLGNGVAVQVNKLLAKFEIERVLAHKNIVKQQKNESTH